jgi:hypothetical protein
MSIPGNSYGTEKVNIMLLSAEKPVIAHDIAILFFIKFHKYYTNHGNFESNTTLASGSPITSCRRTARQEGPIGYLVAKQVLATQ